jgi:hypothetical protein
VGPIRYSYSLSPSRKGYLFCRVHQIQLVIIPGSELALAVFREKERVPTLCGLLDKARPYNEAQKTVSRKFCF